MGGRQPGAQCSTPAHGPSVKTASVTTKIDGAVIARPLDDEVQETFVGRMEVFEYQHGRASFADPLEERANCSEEIGPVSIRHLAETEETSKPRDDPSMVVGIGEVLGDEGLDLVRDLSASSVSAIRARWRTISPNDHRVTPSPYAGERPWCQSKVSVRSSTYCRSSQAGRDFPMHLHRRSKRGEPRCAVGSRWSFEAEFGSRPTKALRASRAPCPTGRRSRGRLQP